MDLSSRICNYLFWLLATTGFSEDIGAQITSQDWINPIDRFNVNPAINLLPGFYLEIGHVNIAAETNFKLGEVLGGNVGEKLQTLARGKNSLFLNERMSVRPFAMSYSKVGKTYQIGLEMLQEGNAYVDADFIQLVTEGISLLDGEYYNNNSGINFDFILKERAFFGFSKKLANGKFGFRINIDAPLAGVSFVTNSCLLDRKFSADTNYLKLEYSGSYKSFGEEIISTAILGSPSMNSLRPKQIISTVNFGIERSISNKFDIGVSIVEFPINISISPVNSIFFAGNYSFTGLDYAVGQDSLNTLIQQSGNLNFNSVIPDIEVGTSKWDLTGQYSVTVHARVKRQDNSSLLWYVQRKNSPFVSRTYSGIYYYDWESKFVQTSYGLSYLLEYGILNPSISARILFLPWTRLTLSLNNPFSLPRFEGGMPLFHSDWSGLNFAFGLSFGKYHEK